MKTRLTERIASRIGDEFRKAKNDIYRSVAINRNPTWPLVASSLVAFPLLLAFSYFTSGPSANNLREPENYPQGIVRKVESHFGLPVSENRDSGALRQFGTYFIEGVEERNGIPYSVACSPYKSGELKIALDPAKAFIVSRFREGESLHTLPAFAKNSLRLDILATKFATQKILQKAGKEGQDIEHTASYWNEPQGVKEFREGSSSVLCNSSLLTEYNFRFD